MTIADVAAHARVSTATVSRVLSGEDSVGAENRARVRTAVAALDYRPSAVARALRQRSTATLGLVVTDIANPFYPELVLGVEDEARRRGLSVLLCNAANDADRESGYLDLLLERRVDAAIIASGGMARRHVERLAAFPVPVVLANARPTPDSVPAVACDDHTGGWLAATHLLSCGHRHILHLAGSAAAGETSKRVEGVRAAVNAHADAELTIVASDGTLEGGRRATMQAAEMLTPRCGVTAHNDLTAIGALSALRDLGLSVPADVGVVGFDDIALSAYVDPPLTTIKQEKYAMGAWTVDAVSRRLDGQSVESVTWPIELIVRRSTGPGAP
ncbi:MAG: LacI family DNA-binding transcriptional regulator [Egibacteraceae bacterium]